jgi:diguanylate cyclase (GGDEF)-like protein
VLDWFNSLDVEFTETAALAAVALFAYIVGRRTRTSERSSADHLADLGRATRVAIQLESIADAVRQNLACHHSQVEEFRKQLRDAQQNAVSDSWKELCTETEAILAPTLDLAENLTRAYDQIRQQSHTLQEFTAGRTDPVTGAGNRRGLIEQLEALLSDMRRGKPGFSLVLVGLDRPKRKLNDPSSRATDHQLQELSRVIQLCMRDVDFIARYGDDEFAIIMPQATLQGASVFGDRLRKKVWEYLTVSVSCGIAEAQRRERLKVLLARVDSALYSAKASGKSSQFIHTGTRIHRHGSESTMDEPAATPAEAKSEKTAVESVENREEACAL